MNIIYNIILVCVISWIRWPANCCKTATIYSNYKRKIQQRGWFCWNISLDLGKQASCLNITPTSYGCTEHDENMYSIPYLIINSIPAK